MPTFLLLIVYNIIQMPLIGDGPTRKTTGAAGGGRGKRGVHPGGPHPAGLNQQPPDH
jgi:hypothetical protein